MVNIVVVYHSGYGHTKKQAEAVFEGVASVGEVTANLKAISTEGTLEEGDWKLLDEADAIVFGSPTYMGMVSWQFKKFAEASSKRWFKMTWRNKMAAGFTNSGSINGDKHSTLHYMITLAMQHGMVWVGPGLMPSNTKNAQRDDINYLGSFAGLMAQSPVDLGPEAAPPPGDLTTAKLFGERVAAAAKQWSAGIHKST